MSNQTQTQNDSQMSDARMADMERMASKSVLVAVILGSLGGPLGYIYVGKWNFAVINVFTLNYLLVGIVIVPLHTTSMILSARKRVHDSRKEQSDREIWHWLGKKYQKARS
jgi:hypothetical protein